MYTEAEMKPLSFIHPLALPVLGFATVIAIGALALWMPACSATGRSVPFLDALFTATSATCVTGLITLDTGGDFSRLGQVVILTLIQLGGLGIMTYASLIYYLWNRRVSLADRKAVGEILLYDSSSNLGHFLIKMTMVCVMIELMGALLLWFLDPAGFHPFSALFHSVSAFCNAGFSLYSDSLTAWSGDPGVNLVFIVLIISGGLGFAVLLECHSWVRQRWSQRSDARFRLSWHTRIVLSMTAILIVAGWGALAMTEAWRPSGASPPVVELTLQALFQSVTCRTAGFNTMDVGRLAPASLLVMILLMFIGGAPGSCAGGVKVTTFAVILGFIRSVVRARRQAIIGRFAVSDADLNKAFMVLIFTVACLMSGAFALMLSEGERWPFLNILFETVSAFSTVGLSTGVTPTLSGAGKLIVIALMFVGRLGPMLFLSILVEWQRETRYRWPENKLMVG